MLFIDQFDSPEAYDAAKVPDSEYDIVRKYAREEAKESFTHIDITDRSTVKPDLASRHPELHQDKLEEKLGRPPTRDEFNTYLNSWETEYEELMVKAGIVDSIEEARTSH